MERKIIGLGIVILLTLLGEHLPLTHQEEPLPTYTTPTDSQRERAPDATSVVRVVDGDTLVVLVQGVEEKVRLIGVDTPETVDPRKPVQCFGKEASNFTKSLVENKTVRLESDATQGDRDKYGRLLRYVFLPDGTLVNKLLIGEGYAHEYTYRIPYEYQQDFKDAQAKARTEMRGLWAPDACASR